MPAANTVDCFRECVGHRVVGVLHEALPVNRRDLQRGNKTLVLDDGRGLTIASSGSYWIDSADEVRRAIRRAEMVLREAEHELAGALELAGAASGGRD